MSYSGNSIVDYLKSINGDSSYAARAKKAAELGISGYTGTAAQNTQMLNTLRSSSTPTATTSTAASTTPAVTTPTVTTPVSTAPTASTANTAIDTAVNAANAAANSNTTAQAKNIADSLTSTSSTSTTKSAAETALDNVSPTKQNINALVESLIGSISTPTTWNSNTDTDYQTAVGELVNQANTAYDNTNADYLGNQSGNFNSAALQIASSAKNDLLDDIPALQQEYEDRYNTQQQQQVSNTSSILNTLLGIEDTDYTRETAAEEKKVSDYLNTIGQYSDNYKLETNRIETNIAKGDTSEQWKLPYLNTARQEKIAAQAEAEAAAAAATTKAEKEAYEAALDMWETSGTATSDIASILGVEPGAKTADYDIKKINAATSAKNAETTRMNAAKSSTKEDESLFDGNDYYKTALAMKNEVVETTDPSSFDKTIKTPKYTSNDIIGFVFNSGLDEGAVGEVLTMLQYTDRDVERYLETILKKDSATSADEMRKESVYLKNQ